MITKPQDMEYLVTHLGSYLSMLREHLYVFPEESNRETSELK